jgi:hypothetical protein
VVGLRGGTSTHAAEHPAVNVRFAVVTSAGLLRRMRVILQFGDGECGLIWYWCVSRLFPSDVTAALLDPATRLVHENGPDE